MGEEVLPKSLDCPSWGPVYVGQGPCLSQEYESFNQGWTMERNQILQKVVTGREAGRTGQTLASRLTTLLQQSLAAGAPTGDTLLDRTLASPEAGPLSGAPMVCLLQATLPSGPPTCLTVPSSPLVSHISSSHPPGPVYMVLRPGPVTQAVGSQPCRALLGWSSQSRPTQDPHLVPMRPMTAALERSCPMPSMCQRHDTLPALS